MCWYLTRSLGSDAACTKAPCSEIAPATGRRRAGASPTCCSSCMGADFSSCCTESQRRVQPRVRARRMWYSTIGIGRHWSRVEVHIVLVAFWRPNPSDLSLLVSVHDARKLLINFAWGARGPGFKSRRPDHSFQRLTRPQPQRLHQLGPNWVQFRSNLERGSSGSHGRHGGLPRLYSRITIRRRQEFPYTCKLR